jgi:ribosomal protein S27AE
MVYHNNFVAAIKVNGKILRENKDVVALPFGSEYSIYLKNQNSVRALVRVSIDGKYTSDVSDGWFIIGANDTLELERFIHNGNFDKGNCFKFIERTAQIEQHRGIGGDDGLVRVEYKFEVVTKHVYNTPNIVYHYHYPDYYPNITWTTTTSGIGGFQQSGIAQSDCFNVSSNLSCENTSNVSGGMFRSAEVKSTSAPAANILRSQRIKSAESHVNMCSMQETALNDAGITVAGSESHQKFSYGAWFPTESTSQVIVLKLLGQVGTVTVKQPITVQQKPVCSTCGKVNKATHQFCGRCGTALQLL